MTTPEKQRRREFLFIALVGVVMATFVGLSFWDSHAESEREKKAKAAEDRQTALFQKCITDVVGDLVEALNTRSNLALADAKTVTDFINDVLKANGDQAKAQKAVDKYNAERAEIAKIRKDNPFPPFPSGKCEFQTKGEKATAS